MGKRYFKIDTGRYGGEIVIGTVTPEFVEYWQERDEDDLVHHVYGTEWEDEDQIDADSPAMTEDGNIYWHDVDDFEHLNGPYADNKYWVSEIKLADGVEYLNGELVRPDGWDYATPMYEEEVESEQYDYGCYVYSREAYTHEYDSESGVEHTPVLCFHSAEKGGFGEIFIETDEKFDPNKLAVGTCETDLGEIIEAYWYDGVELVIDYDNCGTNGKGTYACVGYINPEWHDDRSAYTSDSDFIKQALEELYE